MNLTSFIYIPGLRRLLALCLFFIHTGSAAAQELEEIVVTAQKRDQNQQDVPVAVSSFSGSRLTETGVTDVFDLQAYVPSLVVGQAQNTTSSNFAIRGVGTSSQNYGLESSVGLYVDGVYRAAGVPECRRIRVQHR